MNPKSHLSSNTASRKLVIFDAPPEPLKPSDFVEIREQKELSIKQREQMKSYTETSKSKK